MRDYNIQRKETEGSASQTEKMADFILKQPGLEKRHGAFASDMKWFIRRPTVKQIAYLYSLFEEYQDRATKGEEPEFIQLPRAWVSALQKTTDVNAYNIVFQIWSLLSKHPKGVVRLDHALSLELQGAWELNRLGLIFIDKELRVTINPNSMKGQ